MPRSLSLRGVLCPEQGQGGTASTMYPAVLGIAVTPGLMPPPCPGMASLPNGGAVARPHPDEAGTVSAGHFLSREGPVVDVPDGSSAITNAVSVQWNQDGSSGSPHPANPDGFGAGHPHLGRSQVVKARGRASTPFWGGGAEPAGLWSHHGMSPHHVPSQVALGRSQG